MPNNGKALTNASFRAKMLEVIDKLKDQDKTALVRHVDDFEALNKDTFEAGMNALVEAIPEGGGGGGGTGDGGYVVTFGIDMNSGDVTCNKTIDDIIAHADKHVIGRFVVDFPIDGAPGTSVSMYCDNLKFDYQQFNSDNPEIAPMIPMYTYLGFTGDAFVLGFLDGEIRENQPVDPDHDKTTLYYKQCISIYYLFNDENPHWEFGLYDIHDEDSSIDSSKINMSIEDEFNDMPGDPITIYVTGSTGVIDPNMYGSGAIYKMVENFAHMSKSLNVARTALSSQKVAFHNTYSPIYSKPAQFDINIEFNDSGYQPYYNRIFTISRYIPYIKDPITSATTAGRIVMFSDDYNDTNNKIIRHIIDLYYDSTSPEMYKIKGKYKQVEIPYTVVIG